MSDRARAHLADPLRRNGYSLVLGSAVTSLLGMAFWVLAARLYSPSLVGVSGTLIAAMGFLSNASTLGLRNGFIRFLPTADGEAGRFIRNGYVLAAGMATIAAVVFILGQPLWADELNLLREGLWPVVNFVVATAAWTVFVLQDSALTGLRLAPWVPIENTAFAVAKLLLLIALVSLPTWGIFVAWSVPALVLLVPVNVLIVRRLRSRRDSGPPRGDGIVIGHVVRFAVGDHASAFLWLATTELIPLVVLAHSGADASAVYFLSFTIAYSLYLVTSNISSAFVVEAASHPDREEALLHTALVQAVRLVVPAAVAGAALAPWLLTVLGEEYRDNGVTLLRLLLLSAIPQLIVGLSLGRARLHRHIRLVIIVYAVTAASLFTGAVLFASDGLGQLGWLWLVTQTILAVVLGPTVLRPDLGRACVDGVVRRGGSLHLGFRQRRRAAAAIDLVPEVLRAAGEQEPVHTMLRSNSDVIVAAAHLGDRQVVVRLAASDVGDRAVQRHERMTRRLCDDPRLNTWRVVVPPVVVAGTVDGRRFVIETQLPGRAADEMGTMERAAVVAQGAEMMNELYRLTTRRSVLDQDRLRALIDEPLSALRSLRTLRRCSEELDRMQLWLHSELSGRTVELCCVHGDLWAGNLLAQTGSAGPSLAGIVDWENGQTDGLAEAEMAHLWLTEQSDEIGRALISAARHPRRWPETRTLDDGTDVVGAVDLPARAVLVLAWLTHAADGARRTSRPSPIWVRRNVKSVLAAALELTKDGQHVRS